MKVYIQFDFEGVAGFVIRDNQDRNIPTVLDRTRRMMKIATAEVSAAVNGAFEAGAQEVVVWDSHGQGDTLLVEELPERAQLITGEYFKAPWLPFFEGIDAGIYIGGHAMEGTPGAITPHTLLEVNGRNFGEVGMFINECGARNVPVVLVSGDSAVQKEVRRQIPDGEFVMTKEALGPTVAKTITPELSCKLIREAAVRGLKRYRTIKPFSLTAPFRFRIKDGGGYYTDPGSDFIEAYRNFLSIHYGYGKGWPEYNLHSEQTG